MQAGCTFSLLSWRPLFAIYYLIASGAIRATLYLPLLILVTLLFRCLILLGLLSLLFFLGLFLMPLPFPLLSSHQELSL